jgi:hypothetical protein
MEFHGGFFLPPVRAVRGVRADLPRVPTGANFWPIGPILPILAPQNSHSEL